MFLKKSAAVAAFLLALACASRAVEPRPIAHPIPAAPVPPPPILQVINTSGYIFQGTVTQLRWLQPANLQDVATVQITFRVTQAIRGVQLGQTLSIREWAGLWNSSPRYRVGQNVILFLYRPSKLGLTSPVSGELGKFVVTIGGVIRLNEEQTSSLATEPKFGTGVHTSAAISATSFTQIVRKMAEENSAKEKSAQ